MVSLHCLEKSCALRLQALGGGAPKYLQETSEVPRFQALVGFQHVGMAFRRLCSDKTLYQMILGLWDIFTRKVQLKLFVFLWWLDTTIPHTYSFDNNGNIKLQSTKRMGLPWCFGGDGLPQKSLLIVLIRRPFSKFFFSSNLEKVRGVPSLLGLQGMRRLDHWTKSTSVGTALQSVILKVSFW